MKNESMQFPTVIGHVPMHLMCQSKSPILTDKWLKGFWNPSTYEKDTGCQSPHTNYESPCRKEEIPVGTNEVRVIRFCAQS